MSLTYPTVNDVLAIHDGIVKRGERTEAGVVRRGDVAFALTFVEEGHYGQAPSTIDDKATHLMRLLVANHPFVDGNKRTALGAVVVFYGLNGYILDYDDEVRAILKEFASDESSVDLDYVASYLERHTEPAEDVLNPDGSIGSDFIDRFAGSERDQHNGFTDEERRGE